MCVREKERGECLCECVPSLLTYMEYQRQLDDKEKLKMWGGTQHDEDSSSGSNSPRKKCMDGQMGNWVDNWERGIRKGWNN